MVKKNIIFLSFPRTGSNYFFELIKKNSNETYLINEPFHKQGCLNLNENDLNTLSKLYKFPFANDKDQELIKKIHNNPIEFIEYVHKFLMKEKKYFLFKIFPKHLDFNQIDDLLNKFDHKIIILSRRPIDIFISMIKAQKLNKFTKVDTTKERIEIQLDNFLSFHKHFSDHYKQFRDFASKYSKFISVIKYENIQGYSDKEIYYFFQDILKKNGYFINPEFTKIDAFTQKQDREIKLSSKVSNWDEFFGQLRETNNLNKLNSF